MTTYYTTRTDVLARVIWPALGELTNSHDIDAIVDACFTYVPGRGFKQVCGVEGFWQIVEANRTVR